MFWYHTEVNIPLDVLFVIPHIKRDTTSSLCCQYYCLQLTIPCQYNLPSTILSSPSPLYFWFCIEFTNQILKLKYETGEFSPTLPHCFNVLPFRGCLKELIPMEAVWLHFLNWLVFSPNFTPILEHMQSILF